MQCPIDQTALVMSERSGVEIDYCPQCRGIWLDRGELDKILDRVAADSPVAPAAPPAATMVAPVAPAAVIPDSRATATYGAPHPRPDDRGRGYDNRRGYDDRRGGYDDRGYDDRGRPRKRKREGFLGELFDF